MNLSLNEAARLLGKSDRQVRYLIRGGKLPARKDAGRWVIRREDLPLSAKQERAARHKNERAARLAEEILRPDEDSKKKYSVRDLRAYREGASIYRETVSSAGVDHEASELMRESLMLLACGYHEFEATSKADLYARARHQASRAAMALLLENEDAHIEQAERLETDFLPALGGLIHRAARRGRRRQRR